MDLKNLHCPNCGSNDIRENTAGEDAEARYTCAHCGTRFKMDTDEKAVVITGDTHVKITGDTRVSITGPLIIEGGGSLTITGGGSLTIGGDGGEEPLPEEKEKEDE